MPDDINDIFDEPAREPLADMGGGRAVRSLKIGQEASRILAQVQNPPLADRAYELLHIFLGIGIRPADGTSGEELAREAVRWCRALESEAATATERPLPVKRRPKPKRPAAPPLPGEFEEGEEEEYEDDWTGR